MHLPHANGSVGQYVASSSYGQMSRRAHRWKRRSRAGDPRSVLFGVSAGSAPSPSRQRRLQLANPYASASLPSSFSPSRLLPLRSRPPPEPSRTRRRPVPSRLDAVLEPLHRRQRELALRRPRPPPRLAPATAKSRSLFLVQRHQAPSRPLLARRGDSRVAVRGPSHEAVSGGFIVLGIAVAADAESPPRARRRRRPVGRGPCLPTAALAALYRKASSAPSPCCNSRFFTFRASDMPCLFLPTAVALRPPSLAQHGLATAAVAFSFGRCPSRHSDGVFQTAATPRPR